MHTDNLTTSESHPDYSDKQNTQAELFFHTFGPAYIWTFIITPSFFFLSHCMSSSIMSKIYIYIYIYVTERILWLKVLLEHGLGVNGGDVIHHGLLPTPLSSQHFSAIFEEEVHGSIDQQGVWETPGESQRGLQDHNSVGRHTGLNLLGLHPHLFANSCQKKLGFFLLYDFNLRAGMGPNFFSRWRPHFTPPLPASLQQIDQWVRGGEVETNEQSLSFYHLCVKITLCYQVKYLLKINLLDIQVKKTEVTDGLWQTLELIGYFSEVGFPAATTLTQAQVPLVKRLVMGRWSTTLKVEGVNSVLITILCWHESLRIQLKAREANLLFSGGLPGSYMGAFDLNYIQLIFLYIFYYFLTYFMYIFAAQSTEKIIWEFGGRGPDFTISKEMKYHNYMQVSGYSELSPRLTGQVNLVVFRQVDDDHFGSIFVVFCCRNFPFSGGVDRMGLVAGGDEGWGQHLILLPVFWTPGNPGNLPNILHQAEHKFMLKNSTKNKKLSPIDLHRNETGVFSPLHMKLVPLPDHSLSFATASLHRPETRKIHLTKIQSYLSFSKMFICTVTC
ncbi:hypothetical protein VP01_351g1 [Puccinia sorghi]|uniref:Uncharacterized protein n=1 Tax=Puccinia sorghi TaxID=27349 RepID=A0A0L6UVL2_9BASI|nr:hypothetical protein VP01_351g1 [Puccinia sorghi]